jgi:hypothetical protein
MVKKVLVAQAETDAIAGLLGKVFMQTNGREANASGELLQLAELAYYRASTS